ncbi:PilZ domain-containing protein [Qipengyuania flava]|uniref:PilZ domain-containing protein n=1 Tax=Qipengyuania flava TaxID=192812 RepID=UPI001C637E5E|nr:PilZ domain-containing protein [Qipengyuania flava]QYJ07712.1 PilZ domain-containing protein [Qipengyuania flava]
MDGSQNDDRRARKRVATDRELTCRIPARPARVKLLDVSATGCRLKVVGMRVEPGATVHIDLPDGRSVAGTAVWYESARIGVRFESELDEAQAVALGLLSESSVPTDAHVEPIAPQPRTAHWLRRSRSAA